MITESSVSNFAKKKSNLCNDKALRVIYLAGMPVCMAGMIWLILLWVKGITNIPTNNLE